MIIGHASERQQVEAIMRVHHVDEERARFLYAVQRRDIAGDVAPDATPTERRHAGLGHLMDEHALRGPRLAVERLGPSGMVRERIVALFRIATGRDSS